MRLTNAPHKHLQGVGHIYMYTCYTDIRNRDQNEIKQSSCKIGDDQVIKMSICAARIKVKIGPVI